MGLIGKVFGAITGIPTASDKALLDTLCLAAAVDGDASRLELGYALEIALDLPGFQKVSKKRLEKMLEEALEGVRACADTSASIQKVATRIESPEEREQAYTLAAVMEYVDGKVSDDETRFLSSFRAALGISQERGRQILAEVERELKDAQRSNLMNG
ncbi:MAG: tellurite resistance TerB family protein [Deltaproteobacteria bacterium]|nr:tellurite resistance TerB family protein [Deltaproteobacteria bacterium]